jgi:hypothetical protein
MNIPGEASALRKHKCEIQYKKSTEITKDRFGVIAKK